MNKIKLFPASPVIKGEDANKIIESLSSVCSPEEANRRCKRAKEALKQLRRSKHNKDVLDVFKLLRILKCFENEPDLLFWRVKEDTVKFYVCCNDEFYYSSADAEEIIDNDIQDLENCIKEIKNINNLYSCFFTTLWVSRKRKKNPLKERLDEISDERVRKLFMNYEE